MKLRSVTKRHFDLFLNYFQDKVVSKSVFENSVTYFDSFDMTPVAKQTVTTFYIYD